MPKISTTITGSGPDVVLIHGWGLHGGVWDRAAPTLATRYRITCVDLPGFGRSPLPQKPYTLAHITSQLLDELPTKAIWVGWSLGGLFSAYAAATSSELRGMVSVSSTAKFVRDTRWPHATDAALLNEFASALVHDFRSTVQRFLAIQAIGSEKAREEIQSLKKIVFSRGEPSIAALEGGLALLRDADLRTVVPAIRCPTLLLYGERDRLVPPQSGADYAALLPQSTVQIIPGAGHAPFISHPDVFTELLLTFLDTTFELPRH